MFQNEKEICFSIKPIEYKKGDKVIGIADLLFIRIIYDVFSNYAFCSYRTANFDKMSVLENGNEEVPIDGWIEDDMALINNFAKINDIEIIEKLENKELMERYRDKERKKVS